MTAGTKERNQQQLLDACKAAGLPAAHYQLNAEGTVLHVMDGTLVRPFACSNRAFPAQIEQAIREINTIAHKRRMQTRRQA